MEQPIFIRTDGVLRKINFEEIAILEAARNYTKFLAKGYSLIARASLDATLKQMPEGRFLRISRMHAVSLSHVDVIGREEVIIAGESIPVSRKYYPEMLKQLRVIEAMTGSDKKDKEEMPEEE
ncbi:LytR/AlgR family response regulator transcription factor [Chitinophaga barathri]|uniref:LytTR family transcriptional regulator n=1 Tax=Chitinophaga barathri TaxID=1647451 RepID=A0A3N4N1I6_9BACT|nr:LytTR family DNA-binding domain-containing protein [Chitinophaga barathri]RPD41473.1 LytTR family transcriptional regulator [Chitinophaga barathri]